MENTKNKLTPKKKYLVVDLGYCSASTCYSLEEVKKEIVDIADTIGVENGIIEDVFVFDITDKKPVSVKIETIVKIEIN